MSTTKLAPALVAILTQADEGNVWLVSTRQPDRWMVGGRQDARPCTPEVQCLIDGGLLAWEEYGDGRGDGWRFAVPTVTGRALLEVLSNGRNPR